MTYVSWAALHEGNSDALYFEVLLPRLMEAIIALDGIRHSDIPLVPAIVLGQNGRAIDDVARELCQTRDAFVLVFIHADTGGVAQEGRIHNRSTAYCRAAFDLCQWPSARCITITPRRETEAWILADPSAVMGALGYTGQPQHIGLPANAVEAERLPDPKATLASALRVVSGRRKSPRADLLFPRIAQQQSFSELRRSASFQDFEARLRAGLADLGCISHNR